MYPISGRFAPSGADGAGPVHHGARQVDDALHEFLKNSPGVIANANLAIGQLETYRGNASAVMSPLSRETPPELYAALSKMFKNIKKDISAHIETASIYRRDDASGEQWLLGKNIARSEHSMADACQIYGNRLLAIVKDNPSEPFDEQERMLNQACATYEDGLTQIEAAASRYKGLSVRQGASNSTSKIEEDMARVRTDLAQSLHAAGANLRILIYAAGEDEKDWVKKNEWYSRTAEHSEKMVVRQQRAPYLDEVHREMCRNDLVPLVDAHVYAADAHCAAARWQRKGFLEGKNLDTATLTRSLDLAQHHAIRTKHWASVTLETFKEQSLPRATGAQSAAATRQRNAVNAVRSDASEIIIESAALTSWLRRKQVPQYMKSDDYIDESAFTESLRDWLPAFEERSAALEGALLTQLMQMLSKQRVEGHHDLSCHALLDSAVRNLRVLEQEAIAMAGSAKEHGVAEAVVICQELAIQKDQICKSLADDLQRLQDYADLVAEPAASAAPAKLSKRQRQAAAKRARSDNPEGAMAAPALVLFETVMEGTLAGREKDRLMLVDNDLTGQIVAYRHGEDGLWQRVVVDAADADKKAQRRPAAGPAVPAPAQAAASARLTGADKVTEKAQQYREKIQGYLKKMDGEKSFALAQYYHGRATVAQSAALDYLDRLRSDLLEAKTDPDALAAAGAERRRVAEAGRGMAQRLLAWVASQPQHDNGSLAYLLQHAPDVRVKQTLQRKMLEQAKLTRHSLTADFMDEYTIDSGYGHPTSAARLHAVHVHYGTSQAVLDKFTACHLKYGDDNAPVRNKVSLELLKKIAAKSALETPPAPAPAPARRAYRDRRAAAG